MKCWRRVEVLNTPQVTEVISGKRPQGSEGASHAHIIGRASQAEGTICAKALRRKPH